MSRAVVLLAVLLAASGAARAADEWWLLGPAASYHLRRDAQRELHPGIGLEWRFSANWSGIVDARPNSSDDLSVYVVGCYQPWRLAGWRLGGCAGIATGYDKDREGFRDRGLVATLKPIPFGTFAASREWRTFGLNLGFVPAAGGVNLFEVKFPIRR